MFGEILNSHNDIICHNEILNSLQDTSLRKKIDYLNNYFFKEDIFEDKKRLGKIIGGTINPLKYGLKACALHEIVYPKVKIIVLLRRNMLKQAVSFYMASEFYNNWASSLDLIEDKSKVCKREFDLARLEELVIRLKAQANQITEFASSISDNFLKLFYEDIVETPKQAYSKVFHYVGASEVDDSFDFTAGYQKILSNDLRDVISNFDDMKNYKFLKPYI
jgi:hypothetical protein